jgi:putative phosphoribosyl transferase
MFADRAAAGRQLAHALVAYRDQPVVVYALPRGGVVLGVEVARFLEAPLDLILVRKIGHPLQPEYAIGAVSEDGHLMSNPNEAASWNTEWFNNAVELALRETRRQRGVFLGDRKPVSVENKIAIIVDDGLATGFTMRAAIEVIRRRHPQRLVVAVPVAAPDIADKIRAEVDDLVVLHIPQRFGAIGAFYEQFDQIGDNEVIALMKSIDSQLP